MPEKVQAPDEANCVLLAPISAVLCCHITDGHPRPYRGGGHSARAQVDPGVASTFSMARAESDQESCPPGVVDGQAQV